MRLVCSSDWHIGYRAFYRETPTGINQREQDVALSLVRFIAAAIRIAPDVLLIGGDVFHNCKPGNAATLHVFNQLARLRAALPHAIIVCVSGNHDAPKTSDGGGILPLFTHLGVHVVDRSVKRFRFGDLAILAVPDVPGVEKPPMTPDESARWNVSIIHGEVAGAKQSPPRGKLQEREIDAADLAASGWDFCGFGHFHRYEEVAPRCYYSGSLDFCSSNPWQEIDTPKGFIEHDLSTGEHRFHVIEPSRRYVDLPPIDANGMEAGQLDAAIAESAGDVKNAVVRLVVDGVSKEMGAALDYRAIRKLKASALNFQLDLRRPEAVAREPIARPKRDEMGQFSLRDILAERFGKRAAVAGVDQDAFVAKALEYLDTASEMSADKRANEPDLAPAAPQKAVA